MSQELKKKTIKNRQNSYKKEPKSFTEKSKQPILVVSLIRWHWYTIQTARAQKVKKSTNCALEKHFFWPIFWRPKKWHGQQNPWRLPIHD